MSESLVMALPDCLDSSPMTRLLLEHGADPNLYHSHRDIPFGTVGHLVRNSGEVISWAVKAYDTELISLLISHGADLSRGWPLQQAV